MDALTEQLQTRRLHLNLTQRELSEKSGVAYSTLRKLESTGKGSVSDLLDLFKALQMLPQLAALGFTSAPAGPHQGVRRRARKNGAVDRPIKASVSGQPQPSTGLKSERLGLSFPYDWSNPQIDDAVLIAKVLDKARFDDVSRTIAHFGLPRTEQVAVQFGIDLNSGPLGALMPAIRIAQAASECAAA